jgi:hypothetical protein
MSKKNLKVGLRGLCCAYCGVEFGDDIVSHTDDYHRRTRTLCGRCYENPVAAKATASDPDDPDSWWNHEGGSPGQPYYFSDLESRH